MELVNSFPPFSSCTPKAIQRGNGHNKLPATFFLGLSLGALQNASRSLRAIDPLYRLPKAQLSLKGQKINSTLYQVIALKKW
jgi:hypothetical protein